MKDEENIEMVPDGMHCHFRVPLEFEARNTLSLRDVVITNAVAVDLLEQFQRCCLLNVVTPRSVTGACTDASLTILDA